MQFVQLLAVDDFDVGAAGGPIAGRYHPPKENAMRRLGRPGVSPCAGRGRQPERLAVGKGGGRQVAQAVEEALDNDVALDRVCDVAHCNTDGRCCRGLGICIGKLDSQVGALGSNDVDNLPFGNRAGAGLAHDFDRALIQLCAVGVVQERLEADHLGNRMGMGRRRESGRFAGDIVPGNSPTTGCSRHKPRKLDLVDLLFDFNGDFAHVVVVIRRTMLS